jgi:hypothetical protein
MKTTLRRWRPCHSGTMRGFVDIMLPSGMLIVGCTVHVKGGQSWAAPPQREWIDAEGKRRYTTIIFFWNHNTKKRWSKLVLDALLSEVPHALDLPEAEARAS